MPRETFERDLQELEDELLTLGSMVEQAITDSVALLKERDREGSERLIARDRELNERRYELEAKALTLIATQQPMAGDLRTIAAILSLASELERIGDYAKGIGKINLMMGDEPLLKPLIDVPRMADKTRDMLAQALQAFANRDVELARAIPQQDDEVDGLYNQVYRELLTYIISDPRTIDQATYLLWVAHNLERAADRVINICERVIFTVSGKLVEIKGGEREEITYKNQGAA
ncbi:MAG: phosphate signaling complex protein PhoU [Anaerolineae bacterium]|nr:phosphate signaling complex protein PhoU [Anaerolineae bacterium]